MSENKAKKSDEKTKKERIESEKRRLNRQFKDISRRKKAIVKGEIERAAFMVVELEDMEADLQKNGYTEKFAQGSQKPYDRLRPTAQMYNSMNTNYHKVISQLVGLLPKDKQPIDKKNGDGFDDFINARDD